MSSNFEIVAITPSFGGARLTIKRNEELFTVVTYFGNDDRDKFEVNGKVYTYLGGYRYE